MPVWPKSICTFAVSLQTAATEWKLRSKRSAPDAQARALAALLPRCAAAAHWRAAGVEAGLAYETFRSRVPPNTPAQLAPVIARLQAGETDVLWPGRCTLFALTAGTTTGLPQAVPVTEEMLAHFRQGVAATLLYYTVRARNAGIFRGRHLLLGGSTALTPLGQGPAANPTYAAEFSGILALGLANWAERHLYEPGTAVAGIADWEKRLAEIVERTSSRDVTLVASLPNGLLLLVRALRTRCQDRGRPFAHLRELWPNLECFVHTGLPVTPFVDELRLALGPSVKFHEVYTAAEGFVAIQDGDGPTAGLRLLADLGVFFEFIPAADYDESRIEHLGAKAVPLAGVQPGVDYAVLVTTPAGLVRTALGDVVRFVSIHPPRLVVVGRTALQLNTFGERLWEKDVTDSLVAVCARHAWTIVNFHVAPLCEKTSLTGQVRGCHEWWVELKPGTVDTPTGPQIASELDPELQRLNADYAARRRAGTLDGPRVRLVMPGLFEHSLRHQNRWGGQHKLARCANDRQLADQLAQISRFARD